LGYHRIVPRTLGLRFASLVLYAIFLVCAPFEHHDFSCELKTPLHCTACASTSLGADPHHPDPLGLPRLADAGATIADVQLAESLLFAVRSTGRSPPRSC